MPNFTEIEETFCGRMHGRTFENGFIRSTLSKSRPKTETYCDYQLLKYSRSIVIMIIKNAQL